MIYQRNATAALGRKALPGISLLITRNSNLVTRFPPSTSKQVYRNVYTGCARFLPGIINAGALPARKKKEKEKEKKRRGSCSIKTRGACPSKTKLARMRHRRQALASALYTTNELPRKNEERRIAQRSARREIRGPEFFFERCATFPRKAEASLTVSVSTYLERGAARAWT